MEVALVASLARTLRESVATPGSRTLGRLASWTKDEEGEDIPELALNMSLLAEMFLQMFASGLGTLALVWATVVLLGGFSTMLTKTDFWFITAIVFVETTRIVGYLSGLEAKFFADVPTAFSYTDNIFRHVTSRTAIVVGAPIVAAVAFIALSITRLLGIARLHYGGPNVTDTSNGNLKPALILFYALVLTQGTLFFVWFAVAMNRWVLAEKLKEYFKHTEFLKSVDGINLMDRYVTATLDTCIEKGVVSTMNRTLVTFAAELIQSEYSGDHISAVSVLYVVITRNGRSAGVINQICASEQLAGRLFQIIGLRSTVDRDSKAYASEIVASLAGSLLLADIPEAASSISSLLDGQLMESKPLEFTREIQIVIDTYSGPTGKSMFLQGLLILGEFAGNPENCKVICEATDLVSKIVVPVSHGLLKFIGNDIRTVEIVKASLVVVAKLTSGAGETGTKIRRKISEDKRITENLLWIMQKSDDSGRSNGGDEMEILALEILTRLSLGDRTGEFIGLLGDILFYAQYYPLKMPAARALSALAADHATCQLILRKQGRWGSLVQKLVNVLRNVITSEYRAVMAELLVQICAASTTDQDRDLLKPVSGLLSTVLKAFFSQVTSYNELVPKLRAQITKCAERSISMQARIYTNQPPISKEQMKIWDEERLGKLQAMRDDLEILGECSVRFVSSFLDLAVEIAKLGITAEDFTKALATLPMDDRGFVAMLKMQNVCIPLCRPIYSADLYRLKITRATTKLVTWMMQTHSRYILYCQQEKIIDTLYEAMEEARDLEREMLLNNGRANETRAYEPLRPLVENARLLVSSLQQP